MESKNITKTAQDLYMTQSAVTKRLHKLEEELGAPLFIRTVKGLIPTASADSIAQEMDKLSASSCGSKACPSLPRAILPGT